jgi:acetyltransferase
MSAAPAPAEPRPGAAPLPYPAALERRHTLADGRTVTVRPVRREDDARELEFLRGLSAEARYYRFHGWVQSPSQRLLHFLTDIDYDRHMAFVCVAPVAGGERIVGEARYVAAAAGEGCDMGIVIADRWRRSGIAGLLMAALVDAARARGLARMEGLVMRRNLSMLRFARALGFECAPHDAETVRIVKQL